MANGPTFSWLDDFFGPAVVKIGSFFFPKRPVLEFKVTGGASVDAEDDPINKACVVTIDSEVLSPAGVNGDIQLKNGTGALSALHPGSEGDVVKVVGGAWTSAADTDLTMAGSTGDLQVNGGSDLSALAPGTAGYVVKSTGSAWTSGPQAAAWQTVYEVDFTSLSLVTASGNGNFTIDGKTWTVGNFSKATTMSAGGTNGLRILCNSNTTSTAVGTNSFPYFQLPLSQILGSIPDDCRFGLRVSFYTKAFTRSHSNDTTTFILSTVDFDLQRHEAQQYNSSGTQTDWERLVLKSSTKTSGDIAATLTSPSTHDCIQLEIPRLGEDSTLIHTAIASGGAFPTKWYPRAFPQSAAGQWIDIQLYEIAKGYIAVGQVAGTNAATAEVHIGRMRVEVYLYQ